MASEKFLAIQAFASGTLEPATPHQRKGDPLETDHESLGCNCDLRCLVGRLRDGADLLPKRKFLRSRLLRSWLLWKLQQPQLRFPQVRIPRRGVLQFPRSRPVMGRGAFQRWAKALPCARSFGSAALRPACGRKALPCSPPCGPS